MNTKSLLLVSLSRSKLLHALMIETVFREGKSTWKGSVNRTHQNTLRTIEVVTNGKGVHP